MRRMNARVSSAFRQHPAHRANQHRFVMNLTAKMFVHYALQPGVPHPGTISILSRNDDQVAPQAIWIQFVV